MKRTEIKLPPERIAFLDLNALQQRAEELNQKNAETYNMRISL